MANVIATKGIRKVMDALVDQVLRATKQDIKASAEMILDGRYDFDKDGEVGIIGSIVGDVALVGKAGSEVQVEPSWESKGAGTIHLEFRVGGPYD
jgi:hypothetical protein